MKKCKLCNNKFDESQLTKEHYPAKSAGNNDLVLINLVDVFEDMMQAPNKFRYIANSDLGFSAVENYYSNSKMAKSIYPEGRYARTLFRKCNSFLGKYDEAYKKFYDNDGDPNKIKGFSKATKLRIIKAIFGKFLSVPEAKDEDFDFRDFILDERNEEYKGEWKLFFVKRDTITSDMQTAKLNYDEEVVYHLSDDKFIFDLLNFEKPNEYVMNNIFDILEKNSKLQVGPGENGGFYAEAFTTNLFRNLQ